MADILARASTTSHVLAPAANGTVKLAVHAAKTNDGTRPAIVFVHGNSLSSKMFAFQFSDVSLSGSYNLYAIDLPGHGDSDNATAETQGVYGIDGFAVCLAGALKALNLEPARTIVFGHSLGGHIAIRMLSTIRLAAVGFVGTPPFDLPPDFSIRFTDDPNMALLFKPEAYTREEAEIRTQG